MFAKIGALRLISQIHIWIYARSNNSLSFRQVHKLLLRELLNWLKFQFYSILNQLKNGVEQNFLFHYASPTLLHIKRGIFFYEGAKLC